MASSRPGHPALMQRKREDGGGGDSRETIKSNLRKSSHFSGSVCSAKSVKVLNLCIFPEQSVLNAFSFLLVEGECLSKT